VALGLTAATGTLAAPGQASLPWQELVVSALLLVGYAAVVLRLARRRRVATAVPAPVELSPEPGQLVVSR